MRYVVAPLCLLALAGCSVLESDVGRYEGQNKQWDAPAACAARDARLMGRYHNPTLDTGVACSGPAPSLAKAASAFPVTAGANPPCPLAMGFGSSDPS